MADELGFRGTTGDALSVSYAPTIKSPASRKATTSRTNLSLSLSQPSRLPSPRGPSTVPSVSSKSSGTSGKAPGSASSGSSNGMPRFRSLRNILPFGSRQPNNSAAASGASLSRKPMNPPVSSTPTQTGDLRHRRSSSSIPTPGATTVPKGFLSVGRRTSLSLAKEKTLPAVPSLPRSNSEDLGSHHSPIVSITQSPASTKRIEVTQGGLALPDDPFKKPSPVTNSFQHGSSREDFGTAGRRGDLSTIIESELSSLSALKHSPPLNPCKEGDRDAPENDAEEADEDNGSDKQILAQLAKEEDNDNNLSIMHGQDLDVTAATADLSASWEAGIADLRRSLLLQVPGDRRSAGGRTSPSSYSVSPVSGPPSAQDPTPPTSVPVTSKSEVQLNSPESEQEGELPSFDLSNIDPDFAAMLSPKNLPDRLEGGPTAAIAAAIDSVAPPPPMDSPPSNSPSPGPPEEPGRRSSFDPDDAWLAGVSSRRTSGSSRRRTVGLQSSPVRRSRPSSMTISSDPNTLGERPRRTSIERTPINNHARGPLLSPTPRGEFKSPRTSTEDLTETIRRPTVERSHTGLIRHGTATESSRPRQPTAHLYATPSRPSTAGSGRIGHISSDSGRPFLRGSHKREESTPRVHSPTSHSRPTTSLGVSSRTRGAMGVDSTERPATSLSSIGRSVPPLPPRNRKRSLSAATDTRLQNPNIPDWMGPRTVRAFAAAGLLDPESDHARERSMPPPPIPPRAESRMHVTGSRPTFDRDYRMNGAPPTESAGASTATSRYAPSRAGFSEQSQFSSGSRRRASSRTMTMAELTSARVESPVTSVTSSTNARTLFSASTTTSLSCSSPHQQYQIAHFESEIFSLKEKHSTAMEAVLSALADSQRSTKTLREENVQLKGRIQDLEEQLADLAEQLEEARRQPPPTYSPLTRSLIRHQRSSPRESPNGSPSRLRTFVRSPIDSLASDYDATDRHTTVRDPAKLLSPNFAVSSAQSRENRSRTRASTASSVFPVMPSNMSMLLHDDASDANPSGVLAQLQSNTYASSAGSPPASPTLNVNRLVMRSTNAEKNRHATNLSLSSIEMSMLSSLPGSPKSLVLKPEHEKHLCDLKSIDFSVIDSD